MNVTVDSGKEGVGIAGFPALLTDAGLISHMLATRLRSEHPMVESLDQGDGTKSDSVVMDLCNHHSPLLGLRAG